MASFNGDFFLDFPFYLDPNFGYEVGLGIYDDLEKKGIPPDEYFNPEKKKLLLLKQAINRLAGLILLETGNVQYDIALYEQYSGENFQQKTGLNILSQVANLGTTVQALAGEAVALGIISKATASTYVVSLGAFTSGMAVAVPFISAFIGVVTIAENIVLKNRLEQIKGSILNRIQRVNTMNDDLKLLLNQLPNQDEKLTKDTTFKAVPNPDGTITVTEILKGDVVVIDGGKGVIATSNTFTSDLQKDGVHKIKVIGKSIYLYPDTVTVTTKASFNSAPLSFLLNNKTLVVAVVVAGLVVWKLYKNSYFVRQ